MNLVTGVRPNVDDLSRSFGFRVFTIPKMGRVIDELETFMKRLSNQDGVQGILVTTVDGTLIKSTLDQNKALKYTNLVSDLVTKAQNVIHQLNSDVSWLIRMSWSLLKSSRKSTI